MNFHSESVDFVIDFCVNFFCGFLGAFLPFKRRTENPQRNPLRNSWQNLCKIHACSEKRRWKIHSAGRGARGFGGFVKVGQNTWIYVFWPIFHPFSKSPQCLFLTHSGECLTPPLCQPQGSWNRHPCEWLLWGSDFDPHPQPQSSLLRIFRLQPGLEWKFLPRRTWPGQKLLPLQFPGLSLPY